jgi:Mg2+ and Co2+ transporter CorA
VEKLERRVLEARAASHYFEALHAGTPLVRSVRNLHHTLQAAREAVPADKDLIALRDQAYDLDRAADLIHTQARDGLAFTMARRAEEQARHGEHMLGSAHRLNLLAALFLPITALGSVLGMNLSHGLEGLPAPLTFWATALLALGLGGWIRSSMSRPASDSPGQ